MKKFICLVLSFGILATLCACGSAIEIPDVSNTDEAVALNVLSSNGLIPTTWYETNEEFQDGRVIRTDPPIGTRVDKNTKVTVYISTGPAAIVASNAIINWRNMTDGEDFWEFFRPYVSEGVLYIDCSVTFASTFEWSDPTDTGKIMGIASLNDSFEKTVPISAKYTNKQCKANERQDFMLEIPLNSLGEGTPTNVYIKLYTRDSVTINIDFNIVW